MTPFLQPTPLARLAAGLVIATAGLPASAAILSQDGVSYGASNVGTGTTVTGTTAPVSTTSQTTSSNVVTTQSIQTEIRNYVAPTATTAGSQEVWARSVTQTDSLDSTVSFDNLSFTSVVTGGTPNLAGDKWLSITGVITAAQATSVDFWLDAAGQFNPSSTPFGTSVPLLASFYFSSGNAPSQVLPNMASMVDMATTTYQSYTFKSTKAPQLVTFAAGESKAFAGYVFARNDVSLANFGLYGQSAAYGLVATPVTTTTYGTWSLVSTQSIAAVPEPDTVAMMLVGLGGIGLLARTRRRNGSSHAA